MTKYPKVLVYTVTKFPKTIVKNTPNHGEMGGGA